MVAEQEGVGDGAMQCWPTNACVWWSPLAVCPRRRGREGCGRVVEWLGHQARATFARRELDCGGLDGEGDGGAGERDEAGLPERS